MKFTSAKMAPEWRLFISDEITEDFAATITSFPEALALPSGGTVQASPIDFSGEFIDFHKALDRVVPVETRSVFVGRLVADNDGVVIFGAGADWWWTCFVNGEKVFDRGKSFPNGNAQGTFSKTDWMFPVKVRKGENIVVLHMVSGQFWSLGAGLLPVPDGVDADAVGDVSAKALDGLKLRCNTTRDPIGYKVGEDIDFVFELLNEGASNRGPLFLVWSARGDDGATSSGFSPIENDKPLHVVTRLARPGFVHVAAKVASASGAVAGGTDLVFEGGAGAGIAELRAAAQRPADFDEYWARQRARLDAVPLNPELELYCGRFFPDGVEIPAGLKVYKVKVACAGPNPVTGFLSMPKEKGRYPARVVFDGYSKDPKFSHRLMTPGMITLHVNAHGYELFRGPEYYEAFFKPFERNDTVYAFSTEENANPDTAYFNGMALRVMRSLDFVKTLPEWNGRDLFAQGGSQGGLQAIWAASLEPKLTRCDCSINWCSNIAGVKLDSRMRGWHPEYVPGLDYYDTVFHASHIPETCFVDVLRIGLGDYTCPPSGITAMYNAIKAPKRVAYYQNSTHMFVPFEPTISRLSSLWK